MKSNKGFGVTWACGHGQQTLNEHDCDTNHPRKILTLSKETFVHGKKDHCFFKLSQLEILFVSYINSSCYVLMIWIQSFLNL